MINNQNDSYFSQYVLEPLTQDKLKNFFDEISMKVLNHYINTAVFSQPEILPSQEVRPIQIPKEHFEQWVVQALNVKSVGSGNYPIDVVNREKSWGADIKGLRCKEDDKDRLKNGETNETSLIQKFIKSGNQLDADFASRNYIKVKNEWIELWKNKLLEVKESEKLNEIYYFIVLIGIFKFYLLGLRVNINLISKENIGIRKTSDKSIFLSGVIDDKYGSVKIYKSKKRMELRLKPKNLLNDQFLVTFDIPIYRKEINMYELIQDEKRYESYLKEKVRKIFRIK